MTSTRLCHISFLVLSLAASIAPLGCIADVDSDSQEADETEEIDSAAQAITLSDLPYRLVTIRNRWNCPGDSRCGAHLSWSGSGSAKLYPANNTADLVPWRLIPVAGKTDEFYMRNEWSCPSEGHCDQHLSWGGDLQAKLYPANNTADLVPWKFIPVPGTTDRFYIKNRWACPGDSRCDKHLSWGSNGDVVALYDVNDTANLVPWEVTAAPAPTDPLSTMFRSPNGARPPASYGRGTGTIPGTCPSGYEKDGLSCYPICQAGYHGSLSTCFQVCPSGYTDTGLLCTYAGSLTTACSWSGFTCSCPANYTPSGLWCSANTITKASYVRSAGAPTCAAGEELDPGGLCYPRCDVGYKGVGPVCWVDSLTGLCAKLYDPTQAKSAVDQHKALTFGIGAGIGVGLSTGYETGVAYGEHGEYGCYTQSCAGLVTNVAINAWASFGVMTTFADVPGSSRVVAGSAGAWIVGASAGIVTDDNGVVQGTQYSLSLGAGLSPIDVSVQSCDATVTRMW